MNTILFLCESLLFTRLMWKRRGISIALPGEVLPLRCVCRCAHRCVCVWESDSKASVSTHVHYTHSLWQQKKKKERKGSRCGTRGWRSLRGASVTAKHTIKKCTHNTTERFLCRPLDCAALMVWGRRPSMGSPLVSRTDGWKETTHWSWLTTLFSAFIRLSFLKPNHLHLSSFADMRLHARARSRSLSSPSAYTNLRTFQGLKNTFVLKFRKNNSFFSIRKCPNNWAKMRKISKGRYPARVDWWMSHKWLRSK